MPSCHRISAAEGRACVKVWGRSESSSAIQAILSLARDPAFDPSFDVLVDARELADGDPQLDEIEDVATSLEELRDSYRGKIAIVSPAGRFFDLLRLLCAFAESHGIQIRTFVGEAGALDWLRKSRPEAD